MPHDFLTPQGDMEKEVEASTKLVKKVEALVEPKLSRAKYASVNLGVVGIGRVEATGIESIHQDTGGEKDADPSDCCCSTSLSSQHPTGPDNYSGCCFHPMIGSDRSLVADRHFCYFSTFPDSIGTWLGPLPLNKPFSGWCIRLLHVQLNQMLGTPSPANFAAPVE
ncbi:hypothetical protein LWI28_018524 [Acer negundo]|uniref:Uncharacterized protein n=1 Tax=Acer negundo TaxID=4023 RepID=A0AAD5NNL9_ACENE|nr:hypothetical protein LWI28_018524 [Acer negundo]